MAYAFCEKKQNAKGKGVVYAEKTVELPLSAYNLSTKFSNFKKCSIDIIITNNGDGKCTIRVDEKALDSINAVVEGSEIKIIKDPQNVWKNVTCTIFVDAPVNALTTDGLCSIDFFCESESVKVDASSTGEVKIKGKCKNADFKISGCASIDSSELKCENMKLNAADAASANVFVSESLLINAAGVVQIVYEGNPPHVEKNTSGIVTINGESL